MKLKNILIVVNDVEKSKVFYKDLFGLDVVTEQEGNAVLTEGLVLRRPRPSGCGNLETHSWLRDRFFSQCFRAVF